MVQNQMEQRKIFRIKNEMTDYFWDPKQEIENSFGDHLLKFFWEGSFLFFIFFLGGGVLVTSRCF